MRVADPHESATVQRIRDEGFQRSQAMQNAAELIDGIGSRLTASPNMQKADDWAVAKMKSYGLSHARLEDWGPFGRGWRQRGATGRMVAPDYWQLWLAAAPWSPSTNGAVTGDVVILEPKTLADLEQYRGKLRGKIVLYGAMRPVPEVFLPLAHVWSDAELHHMAGGSDAPQDDQSEAKRDPTAPQRPTREGMALRVASMRLMQEEGAAAILMPSRDGLGGAGTGIVFDDESLDLVPGAFLKGNAFSIPTAVVTIEGYGRLYRLAKAGTPVRVEVNLDTEFTGDGMHGYNAVAEIPGTDPKLKEQVVLLGAHLDSWFAGTGATDDGAGTLIALEAMRILAATGVRPKRTIRLALWDGEEQGLWGSSQYIAQHLGTFEEPEGHNPTFAISQFPRRAFHPLPEWKLLDAYYNLDGGTGRIRGIHTQGDSAVAPIFQQWMPLVSDLGASTVSPHVVLSTDHIGFDRVGIPAFQFIQDPLDYQTRTHHTNVDTFERLQEDGLKQAAVVTAVFLWETSQRDEMLPRKTVGEGPVKAP